MKNSFVAHNFLDQKWRSSDIRINENVDFAGLLLSEKVQLGLKSAGFIRPSPIQLQAIPLGRCGLDMIVQAKSGTGKTCVFTVVALETLLEASPAPQVLILAPTREIAVQIQQVVLAIGCSFVSLQCHAFIGGLPVSQDKVKLKHCQIAVGTPGRIKQLIEEGALKTNSIRMFVLDEADKLFDDSFKQSINWIFGHLPENKQMIAASATYPEELAQLLTRYMRAPIFVRLDTQCQELLGITQFVQEVEFHPLQQVTFQRKTDALLNLLKTLSFSQCLVFTNYQGRAESLCDSLTRLGWPAVHISGGQEQSRRLHAVNMLKEFKCRILVSTDVTSRGIDAENVNLVVNFDVPWDAETYLHRVGRAGRFGTRGIALTLASKGKEHEEFQKIKAQCRLHISPLPDLSSTDLWDKNRPSVNEEQIQDGKETGSESTERDIRSDYAALFREPQQPIECLTYTKLAEKLTEPLAPTPRECLILDDDRSYDATQLEALTKRLLLRHKSFWNKIQEKALEQRIVGRGVPEERIDLKKDDSLGGGDPISGQTIPKGDGIEDISLWNVGRNDHLQQHFSTEDIGYKDGQQSVAAGVQYLSKKQARSDNPNDNHIQDFSLTIVSRSDQSMQNVAAGDILGVEGGQRLLKKQAQSHKHNDFSLAIVSRSDQSMQNVAAGDFGLQDLLKKHAPSDEGYRNFPKPGDVDSLEHPIGSSNEKEFGRESSASNRSPLCENNFPVDSKCEQLLNRLHISSRESHENNTLSRNAASSEISSSSSSTTGDSDDSDESTSSGKLNFSAGHARTSSGKLNFSAGHARNNLQRPPKSSVNGRTCHLCHCHTKCRRSARLAYNYDWARNLPGGALRRAYLQYCGYMEDMLYHRKRQFH